MLLDKAKVAKTKVARIVVFIVQATVIMILNYVCKTFIVKATEVRVWKIYLC